MLKQSCFGKTPTGCFASCGTARGTPSPGKSYRMAVALFGFMRTLTMAQTELWGEGELGVVSTFFRWSVIGICESRHLNGSGCGVCHLHRLHLIHRSCCLVPNAAPAAYTGCIPRQARLRLAPNAGFAGSKGCIPSTGRADWFQMHLVQGMRVTFRGV